MATSGLGTRIWRTGSGFAHHLLDPATGRPAWTGVIQATAVGSTGVEAETLAKTALLFGPERGLRVLEPEGGALVLDDGQRDGRRAAPSARRGGRMTTGSIPASTSGGWRAAPWEWWRWCWCRCRSAFGLAMSGKLVRGPGVRRRGCGRTHEALALSGLLAIVLHGLLLLPDTYLHPGLAGIAIPFVASHRRCGPRRRHGRLDVRGHHPELLRAQLDRREGVAAAASLDARRLGARLAHTLGSGTDAGAGWLLAMLAISTLPVLVAGAHRVHTRGLGPLTATP